MAGAVSVSRGITVLPTQGIVPLLVRHKACPGLMTGKRPSLPVGDLLTSDAVVASLPLPILIDLGYDKNFMDGILNLADQLQLKLQTLLKLCSACTLGGHELLMNFQSYSLL